MSVVSEEAEYLRRYATTIRQQILTVPGGTDGIAAMTLRSAAVLLTRSATLAENYEAERILREEGKQSE